MGLSRAFAPWLLVASLLASTLACISPDAIDPFAVFGESPPREAVAVSDGWLAMGTLFDADLRVEPGNEARARAWLEWARSELARLETIYSRHDPESALSVLNARLAAPEILRDGTQVDAELEAILFEAIGVWEASGGAFDPTIGPLVDVWSAASASGRWPALSALRAAKARVGGQRVLLPGDGRVDVTTVGLRLDLDGLSKGVALDHLRARLEADLPDAAALLSFGESSIVAIGDPDRRREGGGWRLEAQSRDARGTRLTTVRLRDRALSVSSSLGKTGEIEGQRVSHVVDPRTGATVPGAVEAVVVADRAGLADAWSTALLVLGAQRASIELVERAGLEAYVFEAAGRITATPGFEALEVD